LWQVSPRQSGRPRVLPPSGEEVMEQPNKEL
jgi:hypothetical protein